MRFFYLGVRAFSVASILLLCSSYNYSKDEKKTAKAEKIKREIVSDVTKDLLKKDKLHMIACGGEVFNDIRAITFGFYVYEEVDQSQARALIVDAAETLLSRINKDSSLKPYFASYPMPLDNVGIRIWVRQGEKKKVSVGKIDYIALSKGEIIYQVAEPAPEYSRFLDRETYSEALDCVKAEKK